MMVGGEENFEFRNCRRQASLLARRLALDKGNLGALLQQLRQPVDVPIGKPHAAMQSDLLTFEGFGVP